MNNRRRFYIFVIGIIAGYLFGSCYFNNVQGSTKLEITKHEMIVYKDSCVRNFALHNPNATIEDLICNIEDECIDKSIHDMREGYAYLFTYHLNKSNKIERIVETEAIGEINGIRNQKISSGKFELLPKADVIYIFMGDLRIYNSQVITLRVVVKELDGKIVDIYSHKIPVIDTKHGKS